MKCYILAGGKGTRLESINKKRLPKPLIKIAGKPILEWQIRQLRKHDIRDISIISGYKGELIERYFKDGKKWGVNIEHHIEDKPLGTAGYLHKIKNELPEYFLLIYGDSIFCFNIKQYISYLNYSYFNMNGLILTHRSSHPEDSSCLDLNRSIILKWYEKGERFSSAYNNVQSATGIRILHKSLFEQQFENEEIDLDKDILKPLINKDQHHRIYSCHSSDFIMDVGTPERHFQAGHFIKRNKKHFK